MNNEHYVLGGMAGSSMDGFDMALIKFFSESNKWGFDLLACATIEYPDGLLEKLQKVHTVSLAEQQELDKELGIWFGHEVAAFIKDKKTPDLVAIHGHTVVHKPQDGISWQLGDGKEIASVTGIKTVTDFRTKDLTYGGEGAPLVPVGDFELFDQYDACLNLGGIANVSIRNKRTAGDICPCNQLLNHFARKLGLDYDHDGANASKGKVDDEFVERLASIPYFDLPFPKSLPNQFIPEETLENIEPLAGLSSSCEFIAYQVASSLKDINMPSPKLLISGGGAFNSYLVNELRNKLIDWEVEIPSDDIVSFREALIFGFLGMKRIRGEINVLGSVTGASQDTSSGVVHLPK